MNICVYILVLFSLTFINANDESTVNEQIKRRKHHFYCSGRTHYIERSCSYSFSACHSMCETIHREMNDVNPNERVQVGSYRVDGHGHQNLKDVIDFLVIFMICIVL